MDSIYRLGIDLAKSSFEICGVSREGKVLLKKTATRQQLLELLPNIPKTIVCLEACGGSHYWARKATEAGHEVRIVPAQYVKPFVKSQKNDQNDALAITEAAARPTMRFVSPKSGWQQDLQSAIRVRSRVISQITDVSNQLRGLLLENGVCIGLGVSRLKKALHALFEIESDSLSEDMKDLVRGMAEELSSLELHKKRYDKAIEKMAKQRPVCKRLTEVPGVGLLSSAAFVAHIGDPGFYKNGRQAAASLGLVPRQNSTGGKTILLGITKRGDKYLRSLLVHGARTVVQHLKKKPEERCSPVELKLKEMLKAKHFNRVVVALANRNARVLLSMMKTGEEYRAA